jgi:hypothetical protein
MLYLQWWFRVKRVVEVEVGHEGLAEKPPPPHPSNINGQHARTTHDLESVNTPMGISREAI